MKIVNKSKNTVISQQAQMADTVISRLVGLLNRASLSPSEGLVITQCRSIHMFFMKFPIDVIFVNKKNMVVGLVRNIKPFQMSPYYFSASFVIELSVGTIDKTRTSLGDTIEICDIPK